jgi:hypothetical protein
VHVSGKGEERLGGLGARRGDLAGDGGKHDVERARPIARLSDRGEICRPSPRRGGEDDEPFAEPRRRGKIVRHFPPLRGTDDEVANVRRLEMEEADALRATFTHSADAAFASTSAAID